MKFELHTANRSHHNRLNTLLNTIKTWAKKDNLPFDQSWADDYMQFRKDVWVKFCNAVERDDTFLVRPYLIEESKGFVPGNVNFSKTARKKVKTGKAIIATNASGKEVRAETQGVFAKEHGLSQPNVCRALKLGLSLAGWTFRYEDDTLENEAKLTREAKKNELFEKMRVKNRERYHKNKGNPK